ncbi:MULTISPECIES: hypothetical protein [Thiorhodovibrio]|uniref:hypothetical protein n=1 Tax=Thiorhodovibrio TaxID=61593 RepID=UPI0019116F2E|nr:MULTISPECIES: hypothetical protein [Thiorhodovibrio]MBK5969443.1 hypothetical protein [Thiorhodovibrio winogradskyi]WPL11013.1 hypothetical protein Thiosp_00737 [Thiorhodovibrio litoralis]
MRREKPGRVRASRLRVTTDLFFAMVMLLVIILGFLAAVLGLLYWSKVDLGIDLFDRHLFAGQHPVTLPICQAAFLAATSALTAPLCQGQSCKKPS